MKKHELNNTEVQIVLHLIETDDGFDIRHSLNRNAQIKKEYYPVGKNTIMFPKDWGLKDGILHFIKYLIEDQESVIKNAQNRIEKLKKFQTETENWRNYHMDY